MAASFEPVQPRNAVPWTSRNNRIAVLPFCSPTGVLLGLNVAHPLAWPWDWNNAPRGARLAVEMLMITLVTISFAPGALANHNPGHDIEREIKELRDELPPLPPEIRTMSSDVCDEFWAFEWPACPARACPEDWRNASGTRILGVTFPVAVSATLKEPGLAFVAYDSPQSSPDGYTSYGFKVKPRGNC